MSLDTRSRRVLLLLLESDTPLSAKLIAARLGLTPRMVRLSLARAESWMRGCNLGVVRQAGQGLFVAGDPAARNAARGRLLVSRTFLPRLTASERCLLAALMLLVSTEPILVRRLRIALCVSRVTVLRDLELVQAWLSAHGLGLVRRPNYGIQAVGPEVDLRQAITDALIECIGIERLTETCSRSLQNPARDLGDRLGEDSDLGNYLDALDLAEVDSLLDTFQLRFDLAVGDEARLRLLLHTAVSIGRVRDRRSIDEEPCSLARLRGRHEYTWSIGLAEDIQVRFGLRLDSLEVASLAVQVIQAGARERDRTTGAVRQTTTAGSPCVQQLTDIVIDLASLRLHPSLRVDSSLRRMLIGQLGRISDSIDFGLPIQEPWLAGAQSHFPGVYRVAAEAGWRLQEQLGRSLPEGAVASIAICLAAATERLHLHVGAGKRALVVCSAGIATSWLLVSRLRAEMPELRIIDSISALDLRKWRDFGMIDVIIATIPVVVPGVGPGRSLG